jgi:hypothetical protein
MIIFEILAQIQLAKLILQNLNLETYVKNAESEFTAFQPVTVNHVDQLLTGLSSNKATCVDKISCKIIKIAYLLFQIH